MRRPTVVIYLLFFYGLLIGGSVGGSVSAQAYETPHGPYTAFPAGCAACHVAHASLGPQLLMKSDITTLCLTCHDGTASVFNVVYVPEVDRAVYGYGFGTTAGAVYFHPVKNTGNPAVGQVLECTYCHNPHADNPRLLQSTVGATTYTQGPNFCLACHGAVDRGFPSVENESVSYWVYTLGNHENSKAAHYDTTKAALRPASGTLVTCATCHFKHASDLRRLVAKAEENLCFKCHDNPANSMSGQNIKNEFSVTRASYHDIYGERTGAKVECSSCHGPHTVGAKSLSGADTYSQVSNPDNTKSVMARISATQDNGIANTVGTFTDFCLKCHDGSPPAATESTTQYVPYTIVFPSTSFTTNSGGWNKASYPTSAHGTKLLLCTDCHESHGSDYPLLQKYTEDTATGECSRCHRTGGDVVATDVYTDLTKTYRHPTLYISGKHSDTEDYNNMPLADRHAECADCHDPHRCDSTTASAPDAYGSIKGVSGVSISFGTSSFTSWPGNATFVFTLDPSLNRAILYQYELCFKCHSYYSFGTNRPTWPSRPSRKLTDQAKEFNPNNPAYHAVVGESKIPTFSYGGQTYYCGKFVSPWTATSRLYCTYCHGSDSSGVRGPHGSAQMSILRAPWEWNTTTSYEDGTGGKDTNSTGHLCFNCHDKAFYDDGTDNGSETVRSKFGNWYENPPNKWNFHAQHPDVACSACHGAVPHGFKNRGILVQTTDEAPYKAPSFLTINTFPNPGQWKCHYCTH